jgi:hypothetical protein
MLKYHLAFKQIKMLIRLALVYADTIQVLCYVGGCSIALYFNISIVRC